MYRLDSAKAPPPQATLGPPPTLSVFSAGKDVQSSQPAAQPVARPIVPPRATPRSQDAEFDRLAASAEPHDHWLAYQMAKQCSDEATFDQQGGGYSRKCFLAPGKWQDVELRKRFVVEAAMRGEPGAWWALYMEGPSLDPSYRGFHSFSVAEYAEHDRLWHEAYEPSLRNLDAGALAFEASRQGRTGNAAQALTLMTAANAAFARRLAIDYDPNADIALGAYRAKLSAEETNRAIAAGLTMAQAAKSGELKP